MPIKLMVVDDEPEVLQTFKAMAETLGYEAHPFSDSSRAAGVLDRSSAKIRFKF
jgi:hypothetical protein